MPFKPISPTPGFLHRSFLGAITCALLFCQTVFATQISPPDSNTPAKQGQATLLIQSSPLAGSQFHALPDVVAKIRVGDSLTLKRQPDNPHDSNAIQVLWQGQLLGFVPRRENKAVARAMDRGEPLVARVVALRPDESPWRRLRFEISVRLSD